MATISDKAFALLVLENIWDEWKYMNVVEFLRCKGMEKRLEGGIGQVMQGDMENIVDGLLMEWNASMSFVSKSNITELPFQILTKNSSRRQQKKQQNCSKQYCQQQYCNCIWWYVFRSGSIQGLIIARNFHNNLKYKNMFYNLHNFVIQYLRTDCQWKHIIMIYVKNWW